MGDINWRRRLYGYAAGLILSLFLAVEAYTGNSAASGDVVNWTKVYLSGIWVLLLMGLIDAVSYDYGGGSGGR